MKLIFFLAPLCFVVFPASGGTVSFGTFSIDFVDIGNPGNADDIHFPNRGGVQYNYQIGVNEVSEDMILKANIAGGLGLTQDSRGNDKPSTSISWNEAARFVNWLNTSQGFQAAYDFKTQPGDGGYDPNENLRLWSTENAWQLGGENLFRHKDAKYFLPSADEWYKAAYYDGNTSTYFDYANGKDTAPASVASGTADNTAIYGQTFATGPAEIDNAGSLSPYGTMAQNGNVLEWNETASDGANNWDQEERFLQGGAWFGLPSRIKSHWFFGHSPKAGDSIVGFRIAAIPEPSTLSLVLAGAACAMIRRKR
ncbi:MAG: SUMF1/EgtB/PvdO family nonheme iron enzyme [Verrucomicrobiales bacterium]